MHSKRYKKLDIVSQWPFHLWFYSWCCMHRNTHSIIYCCLAVADPYVLFLSFWWLSLWRHMHSKRNNKTWQSNSFYFYCRLIVTNSYDLTISFSWISLSCRMHAKLNKKIDRVTHSIVYCRLAVANSHLLTFSFWWHYSYCCMHSKRNSKLFIVVNSIMYYRLKATTRMCWLNHWDDFIRSKDLAWRGLGWHCHFDGFVPWGCESILNRTNTNSVNYNENYNIWHSTILSLKWFREEGVRHIHIHVLNTGY